MLVTHDGPMSVNAPRGPVIWWAMVLGGAAAALLFAWLIVLVTVPWNLYFAARQVVADLAVSRERGVTVRAAQEAEAARLARRMLWLALGAHIGTAVVVAVTTYLSGTTAGYYFAGFYLLSTAIRPAVAYVAHVRERITVLTRESTYPRDDVVTLKHQVDRATKAVAELREELRRTGSTLAGDIAHARQVLTTDLARVQDEQAADRTEARNRDDELGRRIDQMVRRIEATLDGISDHQELLTGLRALVRMIKPDPA